jgi:hypothetical protein
MIRRDCLKAAAIAPVLVSGRGALAMQAGGFSGHPIVRLLPDAPCIELVEPLSFGDADGLVWIAPAGARSDGASIPRALWAFAGGPLSGNYRDAAIIHDRYCDTMERSWQATHRVFREAMRARGLSRLEAVSKYAAVYLFGPRWDATRRWTGFRRWNEHPRSDPRPFVCADAKAGFEAAFEDFGREMWERSIIADVEREVAAQGPEAFDIEQYVPPTLYDAEGARRQGELLKKGLPAPAEGGQTVRPNTLTVRELEVLAGS